MLDKKTKVCLVIILISMVIMFFIIVNKNMSANEKSQKKLIYEQDTNTLEYVIYDEEGNEIKRVYDESELDVYKDNPDYDPKSPDFTEDLENVRDIQNINDLNY